MEVNKRREVCVIERTYDCVIEAHPTLGAVAPFYEAQVRELGFDVDPASALSGPNPDGRQQC
jgi:hypothetical protein